MWRATTALFCALMPVLVAIESTVALGEPPRREPQQLPDQFKGEAVLALMRAGLAGQGGEAVTAAMAGLLSGLDGPTRRALDEAIDPLLAVRKGLVAAGAARATVLIPGPDAAGREPDACILIEPVEPAGRGRLQRGVAEMLGVEAPFTLVDMHSPPGSILLLPERSTPLLAPGTPDRRARFDEGLALVADSPLGIVVVGTPTLARRVSDGLEATDLPHLRRASAKLLAGLIEARYIAAWLSTEQAGPSPAPDSPSHSAAELGPTVHIRIVTADGDAAAALLGRIAALARATADPAPSAGPAAAREPVSRWGAAPARRAELPAVAGPVDDPLQLLQRLIAAAMVEADGDRIDLTLPPAALTVALTDYAALTSAPARQWQSRRAVARRLHHALTEHARTHNGAYPPTLDTLIQSGLFTPADLSPPTSNHPTWRYIRPRPVRDAQPPSPDALLLVEKEPDTPLPGGRIGVTVDGRIVTPPQR